MKANHNKDYSVVKTFKAGQLAFFIAEGFDLICIQPTLPQAQLLPSKRDRSDSFWLLIPLLLNWELIAKTTAQSPAAGAKELQSLLSKSIFFFQYLFLRDQKEGFCSQDLLNKNEIVLISLSK